MCKSNGLLPRGALSSQLSAEIEKGEGGTRPYFHDFLLSAPPNHPQPLARALGTEARGPRGAQSPEPRPRTSHPPARLGCWGPELAGLDVDGDVDSQLGTHAHAHARANQLGLGR
jgi:hypothetical protein